MDTNTSGRWATALASDEATAREAKSELAGAYWYPAYAFFRASGVEGESAARLTETVLTQLIEDPVDGAPLLREWMLDLAKAALADPTPRAPVLTVDREWSEQRFAGEGTHSPGETFVRRWTLDLLEQAVTTLQAEYEAAGKSDVFAAAQSFLGYTGGAEGGEPYAALAAQLGVSDGAARTLVFELRKRYREILNAAVADTVATEEQIASELQSLLIQLPAPAETMAPRPVLGRLDPEQLLARGMNSVQMSTAGGLGWTPPTIAEAARLFPGYEVVGMLGHGGMGAVYQARQQSLDRLVALKLLPLEISVDQNFADRFRREARAMAKLNHPNIISVHDFGQTSEGHLFFAMEFVEGASLHDLVHKREGGLPPADALGIIEQVCEALSYAHEQGIVHRDIKPANVMIDGRGRAKIADFGLARINEPAAEQWGQTMTGVIMGTPDYMAPEQKRGMQVDSRADIYSVGVMFYEMLCGETPQGAFELPSQRCGLPKELDAVVTRAIAPQVEKRFQTTAELKQAVATAKPSVLRSVARKSQAAAARQPAAVPMVPIVKAAPVAKGNPLVLWGSIAAGVVILGAGGALVFGSKKKPASTPNTKMAAAAPAQMSTTPAAKPSPTAKPSAAASTGTASTLGAATKEAPFVNGLGMKFVPVPITGGPTDKQRVLFSVWDTRVQDYEVFAKETQRTSANPKFEQGPTHPAVLVSWDDAKAFCTWLTERERRAGKIAATEIYRLPSDHEWSCAVGIGELEDAAKLPSEKSGKIANVYPWGTQLPPPARAGNYAGEEVRPALTAGKHSQIKEALAGYRDGFVETSPVGSYEANRFGLYDMGGNVWQWCEDWFDKEQKGRVQRGASWDIHASSSMQSSSRWNHDPDYRFHVGGGFRCVLAGAAGKAPAPALVAAGNEKWVDGLAQWFGGTKTNDDFVRDNNGGARIGATARSLQPIPSSEPKFRDQVVRMRWRAMNPNADIQLYVRLARVAAGKDVSYRAGAKAAKETGWEMRLTGGNPSKVLGNRDWPLPADFKIDASHTMEVRVVGDLITASVDGKKVAEARDSTLTAGNPAFSGHDIVIESFEYANLDPAAPAPALASAKPASATPIAAAAQPGKPVDLLALVDVKRDAKKGEWELAAGGLIAKQNKSSPDQSLDFALTPPDEYDFEVEFTFAAGSLCELQQMIPLPQGIIQWKMGEGTKDPAPFKFVWNGKADGMKHTRLKPGQRYRSVVEVRKDTLRALVDGEEVEKWVGDLKAIVPLNTTTRVALIPYRSEVIFHKAELRPFIVAAGTTLATAATVPAPAKAEPVPVAIAAAAQPGKPVDLLALVDVKRDTIKGEWELKSEGLVAKKKNNSSQLLEIDLNSPEEYDFEIEFTVGEGLRDVCHLLGVPGRNFSWKMGSGREPEETLFAFGPILDGKLHDDKARTEAVVKHARLKTGQRYRSLIEVRKNSLRALIDGQEVLKWTGDFKRLATESGYRLKNSNHLGLASFDTTITYHKAELRPFGTSAAPTLVQANAAAPAAPEQPTKVPTEMEKWLAQVDGPQQESYQREVMKPFEAGLAELQKGYLGALDSRIATASTAGQLDVALGWRNELQRFREGGQAVPADDADLATVAAPLVAKALPPLRTQFRTHKAKLDADRLARAKVAFAKYDAVLAPNITLLTQRQRLDDALLLKTKRDEVQKAWLPAAPAPAVPAPGVPSTPAPKPLGSGTVATPAPAPTSKAATAAAIRAAAEWVIAHGGQVEVPGKKITKPEEIPAGALAVQGVTFKLKDAVPTDAELHALTALGAATNVKVENWDAPDSTLIFLQAFGNAGSLQFIGCPQLTDAILEGLPPMPNVGSIVIKDCPGITGTGLAKLKAPKLNEVYFTRGAPTDAGLAAISQHDGIKTVQAGGPAITDAGVAHLERLRGLTKLILSGTSVTPAALTFLSKRKEFTELDYLNAAAPDFVANAQAIAKIVPSLPTLVVTGKASGPEATRALLGFKSLRSLQWPGSEMNDATFGELAALTDLEDLSLRGAPLTDAAVDTVLALKKLTILDFCDSPELTDAGLLKLKPLKKLKRVHFSRTKATEAGAAELKKAIPGVEVFR